MDKIIRILKKADLLETPTCIESSDCPENYFCDQNSCVAKKREGGLCLSGLDEECVCGKCVIDEETWSQTCLNKETECDNEGNFGFLNK